MDFQRTIRRHFLILSSLLAVLLTTSTLWGSSSGTENLQKAGTPSQKRSTQVGGKTAKQLHEEGLLYFKRAEHSRFPRDLYRKALELWLQEFESDSRNPNTANNIGIVYSRLEDYQTALTYHEKAIELNPSFGHAHYSAGQIYYKLGDYLRAAEFSSKAIEFKYNLKASYYNLGLACNKLKEYERAISAFCEALELKYEKEDCLFNLGVAYYGLGRYDKGIEVLQRLAKDCLYYPKVHFYLGEGFRAQGNLLKARSEYKKAQASEFNKDTDAAKALKEVGKIAPHLKYLDFLTQIFLVAVLPLGIPLGYLRIFRNQGSFHRINKQKAFIFGFLMLFLPSPLYAVEAFVLVPALGSVSMGLPLVLSAYGWQKMYGYLIIYLNYLGLVILNYFIACLLYKAFKNERVLWIINGVLVTTSLLPIYWIIYRNGWKYPMDLKFFGEILLRSLSILFGIG